MNYWILGAVIFLTLWGVLVFVVAPHTGLVHLALGAGVVLLARGIMGKGQQSS